MPLSDIGEDDVVGNGAKKGGGKGGRETNRGTRDRRPKRKRKMTCCEGEMAGWGSKGGRDGSA